MIRLTYRIETPGPVEAMAMKIASDQSTGTFVALPGETEALKARVAARVVAIRPLPPVDRASFPDEAGDATQFSRADVDIDFPLDAIGTDLSALMTIAIGGVFSIKGMTGIRIVDMKLPLEFAAAHLGPQFGVSGSFALTGVRGRPIIGTIVKPALGLRPHETAEMVGELIEAGVDFIKDDEKLMSPAYSSLKDRVAAVMPKILDHEQKTGKKVMSVTIKAAVGEGTIGGPLGALQEQYPDVKMGSYPQMGHDRIMTELVLRSSDADRLAEAAGKVREMVREAHRKANLEMPDEEAY